MPCARIEILGTHSIKPISTIGRPIDPKYPTNRGIVLLVVGVAVSGAVMRTVRGGLFVDAVEWGLGAAMSVFLAWALCREIDPDHEVAAFVAAGFVMPLLWKSGLPSFWLLFWLLLLLRSENQTPGAPASWLDSMLILFGAVWLSIQVNVGIGVIAALGFAVGGLLRPKQPGLHVIALAAIVLSICFGRLVSVGNSSFPALWVWLGLVALFMPVFSESSKLVSVGDLGGLPLEPARVQAAQLLALGVAVWIALSEGPRGFTMLTPLWAATGGAAIHRVMRLSKLPRSKRT